MFCINRANSCYYWLTHFTVFILCCCCCCSFFGALWTTACQVSLSFTISLSLLKLISNESVMPSNHLIFFCPLSSCIYSYNEIKYYHFKCHSNMCTFMVPIVYLQTSGRQHFYSSRKLFLTLLCSVKINVYISMTC